MAIDELSPLTAALNGNWLLAGNQQLRQYPSLSLALIVSGNQLSARGDLMVACANSPSIAAGSNFSLTGQINSDGTFHLGEVSFGGLPNGSSIQLAIDGSAPASGSTTWTGTFHFTDLAGYTSLSRELEVGVLPPAEGAVDDAEPVEHPVLQRLVLEALGDLVRFVQALEGLFSQPELA